MARYTTQLVGYLFFLRELAWLDVLFTVLCACLYRDRRAIYIRRRGDTRCKRDSDKQLLMNNHRSKERAERCGGGGGGDGAIEETERITFRGFSFFRKKMWVGDEEIPVAGSQRFQKKKKIQFKLISHSIDVQRTKHISWKVFQQLANDGANLHQELLFILVFFSSFCFPQRLLHQV